MAFANDINLLILAVTAAAVAYSTLFRTDANFSILGTMVSGLVGTLDHAKAPGVVGVPGVSAINSVAALAGLVILPQAEIAVLRSS